MGNDKMLAKMLNYHLISTLSYTVIDKLPRAPQSAPTHEEENEKYELLNSNQDITALFKFTDLACKCDRI